MDSLKKEKLQKLLIFVKALEDSIKFIYQNDSNNIFRFSGYETYIRKYNQLAKSVGEELGSQDLIDFYLVDKIPSWASTLVPQQKVYFDSLLANISMLRALIETNLGLKESEIENLKNFLQSNLRKAIFDEPKNEIEIQDTIETIFISKGYTKGQDYDRETGRVKYSNKEFIPDFIIFKLSLAVEIKLCKNKDKSKKIVDEMNTDLLGYGKKYSNVLFIIYDIGTIKDEDEFKKDFNDKEGVSVIIVKH